MRTQRFLNAGLLTVLAGMMAACGNPFAKVRQASERNQYMNDMKQIALEMHNYHDIKGRMPKNANELIAASPNLQGTAAASRLMSDEIAMMWDFNLNDQTQYGTSNTLMGWSMSPVFNGNAGVIYADGSVRVVPVAEFETIQRPVMKKPSTDPTKPMPTKPNKTEPVKDVGTGFDVVLEPGFEASKRLGIQRVVREVTGQGLAESRSTVEKAPVTLKKNIGKEAAEDIKKKLEEAGAKVTIKPV